MARVSQRLRGVNGHPKVKIKIPPGDPQWAALRRQQRKQEEPVDEDLACEPQGDELLDEDEVIKTPVDGSCDPNNDYMEFRILRLNIDLCREYESLTGREYPDKYCPKEHQRLHRDIATLDRYSSGGSGYDAREAALKVLVSYGGQEPAVDRDPQRRRKIAIPLELIHICGGNYYMAAVLAQIMYWFDGRNGDQPTINKTRKQLGQELGMSPYTVRNNLTRLVKLEVISVAPIPSTGNHGNNWGSEITLHQDQIKELVDLLPAKTRAYCYGIDALTRSRKPLVAR